MAKVIVLNNDFSILGCTTLKRAMIMLCKGTAETVATTEEKIHKDFFKPSVIRLLKAVRFLWKKAVPWSKGNVHSRDNYTCQYCGTKLEKRQATIDHVIPKDQKGKNSWNNTVCSCFDCNNKKNNRTPSQARMSLKRQPYQPTIAEFIYSKIESEGLEKVLKDLKIYS